MAYIVTHQRKDGSVERKRVQIEGMTGKRAEQIIARTHREKMKMLRDKYGWDPTRSHRLKASIPQAVWEEVVVNEGREAARDPDYLIRRAEELGYKVRTRTKGRGR